MKPQVTTVGNTGILAWNSTTCREVSNLNYGSLAAIFPNQLTTMERNKPNTKG